jgi:hypothetical protein
METGKVVELSDILERAEARVENTAAFIHHQVGGTLEEYYKQVLTEAIMDVVIMPVDRLREGIEPETTETTDDMIAVLKQVVTMVAFRFHKSVGEVEMDMLTMFKAFPTADYREAAVLRHKGMLH